MEIEMEMLFLGSVLSAHNGPSASGNGHFVTRQTGNGQNEKGEISK